ncbi:hypothetical protein Lrub_2410 [Legionella rubrilucens]|uniref:CopG family transcriptional regulator n=1 Tax=Legionella rubrilucens TaxID=458 RepID=A0A0W0XLQ9_9GAMM|nr:hypothetical protein [Legionella rubrilucens]KTD45613.1 hypothetical protein Lrub_2410 [Legionella rubrilucens]
MSIPGNQRTNTELVELNVCPETLASIEEYCQWANITLAEFIEEASECVFDNDTEWKKHYKRTSLTKADAVNSQTV